MATVLVQWFLSFPHLPPFISKMLDLKINLVKYLDKTGDLRLIEENALRFKHENIFTSINNNYLSPLRVSLGLDYMMLMEMVEDFAALLVEEPNVAKVLLSELVHTCCIVLTDWKDITVHLLVRLVTFPKFLSTSENKYVCPGGLFTMNGILAELSSVEKYTQDISFTCKYATCYDKGNIVKRKGKCFECGRPLIEVPRSRLCGEKVVGLLLDPDFLRPSHEYSRAQGYAIEFRDELFIGLEIGVRYNVALTFDKGKYLSWGVQPMLPDPLVRVISNVGLLPIPSAIAQLINDVKEITLGSPWSIVTALSAAMPVQCHRSAFLHLKTALLLSLASICSKSPIPILALGDCGQLLMDVWCCSPRAVFSPSGPHSLLMASYGVCLVHENTGLSSYITAAVDSELVTITHQNSKDKRQATYSLKAAVWMYWSCNKQSGVDIHKLRTLINVFGIPFLDNIDVNDEKISDHILQHAIENDSNPNTISNSDFRTFIDIICGLKVTISEMASTLIRNYFVASRRERPECLPLKAIQVLTSLSESHARLSLRDTVIYEDAVAAIFLYEESISVLFGSSVYSHLPTRTITVNEPLEIAQQMDEVLVKFSEWLQSYSKIQGSSSSINSNNSFDFSISSIL